MRSSSESILVCWQNTLLQFVASTGTISSTRVRFAHTSDGLASLWQAVCKERRSSKDRVHVLLEPTGMSWFPVNQYLQQRGCELVRVTGKQVQALRSYLSRHTKTDAVDAGVLAQISEFR